MGGDMRVPLFILFLVFSVQSFAASYSWRTPAGQTFPSPAAACEFLRAAYNKNPAYILTRVNDSYFNCRIYVTSQQQDFAISRLGDSCPNPEDIYDPATGVCAPPPPDECEEKAGESDPYSKSGDIGDGYYSVVGLPGKPIGSWPTEACMGGCAVVVQANCISTISTNRYACKGHAYYSGTACTASSETPQVEQEENYVPDEPKNTEIKEPCVYTTDSEGRSVCVSKASLEKEGQSCGTYNGQTLCVPKVATKDETTVETEVTETPEPDGGKTTVKKDVATVTKCVGSNQSCTTTTTTTTTTTKSDGSGTTTKTDVVCKGTACGSGTGGVGSGDGSGEGDCTTDDCGDDDITTPDLDEDVLGYGEATGAFMDRVSGSPMLSAVGSIGLSGNGSCSMSSASTVIGTISADSFCDNSHWLDPLYFVFLAIHALAAVRVFLSA